MQKVIKDFFTVIIDKLEEEKNIKLQMSINKENGVELGTSYSGNEYYLNLKLSDEEIATMNPEHSNYLLCIKKVTDSIIASFIALMRANENFADFIVTKLHLVDGIVVRYEMEGEHSIKFTLADTPHYWIEFELEQEELAILQGDKMSGEYIELVNEICYHIKQEKKKTRGSWSMYRKIEEKLKEACPFVNAMIVVAAGEPSYDSVDNEPQDTKYKVMIYMGYKNEHILQTSIDNIGFETLSDERRDFYDACWTNLIYICEYSYADFLFRKATETPSGYVVCALSPEDCEKVFKKQKGVENGN